MVLMNFMYIFALNILIYIVAILFLHDLLMLLAKALHALRDTVHLVS